MKRGVWNNGQRVKWITAEDCQQSDQNVNSELSKFTSLLDEKISKDIQLIQEKSNSIRRRIEDVVNSH